MRMNKLIGVLLLSFCCTLSILGQSIPKYKKITAEDFELNADNIDSTAAAFYLRKSVNYSIVKSRISYTFKKEIRYRIKIQDEQAKELGNGYFYLDKHAYEPDFLTSFKGLTYNLEDGKVVKHKIGRGDLVIEDFSDSKKKVSYALTNVKVGSIIDVVIRIEEKDLKDCDTYFFQDDYPVLRSDFCMDLASDLNFYFDVKGFPYPKGGRHSISAHSLAYHYYLENLPAYEREPFAIAKKTLSPNVTAVFGTYHLKGFGTIHVYNWHDWAVLLDKSSFLGYRLEGNLYLYDFANKLKKEDISDMEKAKKAYAYIQENMTWNKDEDILCEKNLREVWKNHTGSTADMNVMLISLLRKIGLKAYPLFISTKENGYPNIHLYSIYQWNRMATIVEVEGNHYTLDASSPEVPFGRLPMWANNTKAMIVKKDALVPFDLGMWSTQNRAIMGNINVSEQGEVSGILNIRSRGYDATNSIQEIQENGWNETVQGMIGSNQWMMAKDYTKDQNVEKSLVKVDVAVKLDDSADSELLVFKCPGIVDQNPFQNEERVSPVIFGAPINRSVSCNITIPENYELVSPPESVHISLNGNKWKFDLTPKQMGSTLTLQIALKVNSLRIEVKDYPVFRDFFMQAVQAMQQDIILKKKA